MWHSWHSSCLALGVVVVCDALLTLDAVLSCTDMPASRHYCYRSGCRRGRGRCRRCTCHRCIRGTYRTGRHSCDWYSCAAAPLRCQVDCKVHFSLHRCRSLCTSAGTLPNCSTRQTHHRRLTFHYHTEQNLALVLHFPAGTLPTRCATFTTTQNSLAAADAHYPDQPKLGNRCCTFLQGFSRFSARLLLLSGAQPGAGRNQPHAGGVALAARAPPLLVRLRFVGWPGSALCGLASSCC